MSNWFAGFMDLFDILIPYIRIPYIDITFNHFFSRAVRGENFLYVSRGGII